MPEVMKKIRSDLGSDAVILNSKEIKNGGFLGLFKKRQIEVVAALDPQPISQRKDQQTVTNVTDIKTTKNQENNHMNHAVLSEIKYLKRMLEQQTKNDTTYSNDYQSAYEYLLDQEVQPTLAKDLIDSVVNKHDNNQNTPTPEQIIRYIQLEIENRLLKISFQTETKHHQKIIHFVGPTGVGKTTTLAKIAANKMLVEQKKIAFITMDTYRIAAIEQLKTYARILKVPIEVAYSIDDYHKAVEKLSSYDLILVDTAGRNYRDEKYINDLAINQDTNIKTYLVLALTAKPKDIIEIHDQFSHLPINDIIFTKIDETTQYGSMLNIALNKEVNISYITNGQDVPDDIIEPTPKQISNYLLGGYFDE